MRNGILAAGNWIIDEIKIIDEFPHQDGLANVLDIKSNNGGAPYNVLKDLAYLNAPFPLFGAGLVGNDEKGKHILKDVMSGGIDASGLQTTNEAPTSYTDVMTVASTGRRTFFHNRGANKLFGSDQLDLESEARILHMAYLLLLDKMDEIDDSGRSVASYVFETAKKKGFKTSTDIVSEASDRFKIIAPPSLPYIDYLFVNEYESSKLTGIDMVSGGQINLEKAFEVLDVLMDMGVNEYAILHFPDGAITYDKNKEKTIQASINVPKNKIKGTAGAGDAFAAGMLYGLHESWPIDECLKLAVSTAAASLFDESCSDGLKMFKDVRKIAGDFGYKTFPH